MRQIRLNPMDMAWLFTESRATPNHVGGLLLFRLPPGAPRDYLRQMMLAFRAHRQFSAPWNRKLKTPFTKNPAAAWVETQDIDLEYHVRHAALPWPGGQRELGELVGRLQSTPIDLSRPPWECTIIEGLEGDCFGLFVKMHHALIDGVSGMKLLQKVMVDDVKKSIDLPPFWNPRVPPVKATAGQEGAAPPPKHKAAAHLPTVAQAWEMALSGLSMQAQTVPQLIDAFGQMVKRIGDPAEGLAVPFGAPASILNGRVHEKRRFATQSIDIDRLRKVAQAAGCTLNDVVLALCGGALRQFLLDLNALPAQSLTAGIPVSVRPADDEGTGNGISFIVALLGTDIEDPKLRLQTVQTSVKHAKNHVQSLPRQAMTQYTMLLMAPTILTLLLGLGGRTPPMFNITISNVPGPSKPLYFMGAELLSIFPASIVSHGQALNITCESYAGQMHFGFTACHTSVPSMQRLAVHLGQSMDELEAAFAAKKVRSVRAKRAGPAASSAGRA